MDDERNASELRAGSGPLSHDARAQMRVGITIGGKYRLERVLGVGGMATVYSAVHRNGNRVALKMLHAEISADLDLRARFVREGYLANSVAHPGVVRVLDDDVTEDGAAFVVMELLEGETLLARAAHLGGRLPQEEVAAIGHQLASVLAAAHAQGIIHRDIKPENVFLTTEGVLKLLDFGVARVRDLTGSGGATRTGRVMGTPAFMPPEQALGREIDARSDVWACGATMFTLLSGRYVHEAPTPEEVVVHSATRPAPPLATVAPAIDEELAAVVDRALAFDKADRFASALDMASALETASVAAFGAVPKLPAGQSFEARASLAAAPTLEAPGSSGVEPASPEASRAPTKPSSPAPPPGARRGAPRWVIPSLAVALAATIGVLAWRGVRATPPTTAGTGSAPAPLAAPLRCARNGDCASLSPPSVCGRLGACVPQRGCATNAECLARSGGEPTVCRKETGACVALKSPACRELLMDEGDVANDATIWVGMMIGKVPTNAQYVDVNIHTLDLARRDLHAVSNGVPGARPGDPDRPLAIVLCDDATDAEGAARHLVDDVGVPAVIGFSRSKEAMDLTASIFNPRGVLAIASLNTSPMLASVAPSPEGVRLLWRTNTSSELVAVAEAAFAGDFLASRAKLSAGEPLRVAMVRLASTNQLDHADKFVSALRVGDRTVAQGGAVVQAFLLDPDKPSGDHAEVRRALVAFAPHVILDLYRQDGFLDDLFPQMERDWPGRSARPSYVLAGSSLLEAPELLRFVASRPDARPRIFAFDVPASVPANAKLAIHYNEIFSPKVTASTTEPPPYDAVYLLAYAIVAAGDAPVTGVNLARAIKRLLPPGPRIEVGPASILQAFKLLRSGRNIDLDGAYTSLDFDLDTGDAPAEEAVYCLRAGAAPGGGTPRLGSSESGLLYDTRLKKLRGAAQCQ